MSDNSAIPSPVPLPPNPFPPSPFQHAYQRCLDLEAHASTLKALQDCPDPIVCARLLGHLLRLAPPGNGQGQLQREITLATDNMMLMKLASTYTSNFIGAFMRGSRLTPVPSEHPSRPSFEDAREYAMAVLEERQLNHRAAWDCAMRRDENTCMVTGWPDYRHKGWTVVDAVHIIPQSTNTDIAEGGGRLCDTLSRSNGMWGILSMFTDTSIIQDLAGNRIHRLENIMSINHYCHQLFDGLYLWLKPVEGVPHTYRVYVTREIMKQHQGIPEIVTFSTKTDFPLPNAAYLRIQVAWLSGAAEYIMDIQQRMDETRVLANDGSTGDLLTKALALVEDR